MINRASVRKAYRNAILEVFGCGDKDLDKHLLKAVKADMHLGGKDPGGYGDNALLSIYCENGIPNASDIHDFTYEYQEFGVAGNPFSYNSEKWDNIDAIVNLLLEATGKLYRVHHEPHCNAVVNVYED